MEKNEEIIKPIEKQVKRPVMKFISKIATPLAVLIIAIWGIFICNYFDEIETAKTITAEEWKTYSKRNKGELIIGVKPKYVGYSSFNEYKEDLDEKYFEEYKTNTFLIAGLGIGVVEFISRNSYKKGQEE